MIGRVHVVALFAAVLLFPALAAADVPEPLLEEFFLAENANPQEKARVQLTGIADRRWQEEDRVDEVIAHVEYGLTGRWQVEAEVPYVRLRPGDADPALGWGDVELGTMVGVLLDPRRLALSIGVETGLTTSEPAVRLQEKHEVEPFLVLAHRMLGGELDLHFSSGVRSHPDREYDVAFVEPAGKVRLVLEGNRRDEESEPPAYYVTPGLVWKPRHSLELSAGVPIRTRGGPHRARLIVQATAEF